MTFVAPTVCFNFLFDVLNQQSRWNDARIQNDLGSRKLSKSLCGNCLVFPRTPCPIIRYATPHSAEGLQVDMHTSE